MNYNDKYQSFYQSTEWKQLRRQVMLENDYLCAECKRKGKVKQAKAIHHKITLDEDYNKRLEWDNLEPLCRKCHNEAHDRRSELQKFMEEWNGM